MCRFRMTGEGTVSARWVGCWGSGTHVWHGLFGIGLELELVAEVATSRLAKDRTGFPRAARLTRQPSASRATGPRCSQPLRSSASGRRRHRRPGAVAREGPLRFGRWDEDGIDGMDSVDGSEWTPRFNGEKRACFRFRIPSQGPQKQKAPNRNRTNV